MIVSFAVFVLLIVVMTSIVNSKPIKAPAMITPVPSTLYSSITLNIPSTSDGANFRDVQFFAGSKNVTSSATGSQFGVNGLDITAFSGENIIVDGNTAASLTATFTVPQAITSIVYTPHPSFLCRSWGLTCTSVTSNNVSKTGPVLQPSQCTAYSQAPVERGDASSFHYTFSIATNKWIQ